MPLLRKITSRFFIAMLTGSALIGYCGVARISWATGEEESTNLYTQYTATFLQKLDRLAGECDQVGETMLAERIRNWMPQRDPEKIYLFHPGPPATNESRQSELEQKFQELRFEQGEDLLELSRRLATGGQVTESVMVLSEAIYHAPHLAEARHLLGYQKNGGRWITPEAEKQLAQGNIWSDQFGWLPADHLPRYQAGERYYNGRWISREKDARLHADIKRGWKIKTDHYEVTTNHSLEAGVQIALKLEKLYGVWWQVFAAYHLSPEDLKKMFSANGIPRRSFKRHKVVYFRDRKGYVLALGRLQPGIENTWGFYFENRKTAYFYPEEKDSEKITLWHEATHQLFSEMISSHKMARLKNNFWITEGIACFMESLQPGANFSALGGLQEGRLPAARERLEQTHFYIPFDRLLALSGSDIQRNPDIQKLYTQMAGQATFLMVTGNGQYRPGVTDYLCAVYRGTARPETLALKLGVRLVKLDSQYRDFLLGRQTVSPEP